MADYRSERSAEILFKSEGMSRHPAPCSEPRQGAAGCAEGGTGAAGTKCYRIGAYNSEGMKSDNPDSGIRETDKSSTLDLNGGNPACNQGGIMVCVPIYTMRERCGCAGGGKGPLFQKDMSATIACNNDQSVFVPVMLESHPNDSRLKIDESGSCQTLTGRMGTGGGNVPLIMQPIGTFDCRNMTVNDDMSGTLQAKGNGGHSLNYQNPVFLPVFCLQGSMIGREDKNGPQGDGVNKDLCFTLNTADRHAVVYAIDRAAFNQGKNAQFDISIKDDGVMQTVVAKGPNAVGVPIYSFYPQMKAESQCFIADIANTIVNGTNPGFHNGAVVPIITMNERQYALTASEDLANTLTSTDYKGVQLVGIPIAESAELIYIVRRLTPSECALLQGFPADWHEGIENEKGKPMPDTAAYMGYGNAVATVCAEHPIAHIIEILKEEYAK